ncbi:GyrI-like domain-containing protein [Adhaeribacter aquaticus]|uniref:GyrI-like domain-containing protein n=1 Tax=Adhaeribacter aquaticus TaxID=299567 RepID=UPI00047CF9E2|nr:GyrI-like domain-containing protein [Adhaeribacter aquaticus]
MLVLTVVAIGCYAYLGGLNKPAIQIKTSQKRMVAGKEYAGPANSNELGRLFQETVRLVEAKKLPNTMANIYYNNPEKREDSIKAFVGVLVSDTTQTLPAGYSLRYLPETKKIVQASVKAHFILAPNKLYPALFEYIQENKLKTKDEFLEFFGPDNQATLQVEILP